jgi:hypothetical protein
VHPPVRQEPVPLVDRVRPDLDHDHGGTVIDVIDLGTHDDGATYFLVVYNDHDDLHYHDEFDVDERTAYSDDEPGDAPAADDAENDAVAADDGA